MVWNSSSMKKSLPSMRCIGVAPITQIMHVRNINSNIQGKSLNVVKLIFYTKRNCS